MISDATSGLSLIVSSYFRLLPVDCSTVYSDVDREGLRLPYRVFPLVIRSWYCILACLPILRLGGQPRVLGSYAPIGSGRLPIPGLPHFIEQVRGFTPPSCITPRIGRYIDKIDFCTNKSNEITFLFSPSMIFCIVLLEMTRFSAIETSQCFTLLLPLLVLLESTPDNMLN